MNNKYFLNFEKQRNYLTTFSKDNIRILNKKLHQFFNKFLTKENDFIELLANNYQISKWDIYLGELKLIRAELMFFTKKFKKIYKKKFFKPSLMNYVFKRNKIINRAYGVCLVIIDKLFPISKIISIVISALVCGNSVFLKLPNNHNEINNFLIELFSDIFEENYLYFLPPSLNEFDISKVFDLNFDLVFYLGDYAYSKVISRIFAPKLTKVYIDFGIKNAMIIDDSANLSLAAKKLVFTKMFYGGLTYQSPNFLLIHESVTGKFIELLKQEYSKQYELPVNWDQIPRTDSEKNFAFTVDLIKKNPNPRFILYGGSFKEKERKIELTLIQVDDLKSPLVTNQFFSLLLPTIVYNNFADITGIVSSHNISSACFFSKNKKNAIILQNSFEVKYFCLNDLNLPQIKKIPYGYFKKAGACLYGKDKSIDVFTYKEFITKKTLGSKKFFFNFNDKNKFITKKMEKNKKNNLT